MKLKIRSTIRPCLVTTPSRSKTLVVGGTITHVNGEEWDHPYCAVVPGGAITLDDIEWEYAHETSSLVIDKKEWAVPASEGGYYKVTEFNGKRSCTCDGFHYRKTCRHIREVK